MQYTLNEWGIAHEFRGAGQYGRPVGSGSSDKHGRTYEQRIAWEDIGKIKIGKNNATVKSRNWNLMNGNGTFSIPRQVNGYDGILAVLRHKAEDKIRE